MRIQAASVGDIAAHTMQPVSSPPSAAAVSGRRSVGVRKRGRHSHPHNAHPDRPFAPLPRLLHASCICRSRMGARAPLHPSASAAIRTHPNSRTPPPPSAGGVIDLPWYLLASVFGSRRRRSWVCSTWNVAICK